MKHEQAEPPPADSQGSARFAMRPATTQQYPQNANRIRLFKV